MCNCIKDMSEATLRLLTEKHRTRGETILPIIDSEHGIMEAMFVMQDQKGIYDIEAMQLHTRYEYKYTFEKKNGDTSVPRKGSQIVGFDFCPFCAAPYKSRKGSLSMSHLLMQSMAVVPITGQQCIDIGWSNDSMGELFQPDQMYCTKKSEGGDTLIIIPVEQ